MWMCFDKYQAKKNRRRISEKTFFIGALLPGATGIYLGMKKPLYHKAGKPVFRYGIPFVMVLNFLIIALILLKYCYIV